MIYLHIFSKKYMQIIQMATCFSAYNMLQIYAERLVLYAEIRLLIFK